MRTQRQKGFGVSYSRVVVVSLAATLVPSLALLVLRAWLAGGPLIEPLEEVVFVWLIIILPVSLLISWLRLYRLRDSIFTWLLVGLATGVGYRVVVVLWEVRRGVAPDFVAALLNQNSPYYLGDGVTDAFLLMGVGLIVWAVVFWHPEKSRYAFIRQFWDNGGSARKGTMRFTAAALCAGIAAYFANAMWTLPFLDWIE